MPEQPAVPLRPKQYKSAIKPVWCPGCGDFAVLTSLAKALSALQLVPERVALISGIGCSSRIPAYTRLYGFHGIHGRALALAAGLKVARPELTVLVMGGDGDGFSIGGNHFLHACRRNMDLTYLVMDNEVYGMTKGQASPTTAADWTDGKLTPHGTGLRPFQPAAIALAAGATFVARGFSGNTNDVAAMLVRAIEHPGFAFVQVLSPCLTFRPEQKEWKHAARPFPESELPASDAAAAMQLVMGDSGLSTGILYQQQRPVWQPRLQTTATLAEIEQELAI